MSGSVFIPKPEDSHTCAMRYIKERHPSLVRESLAMPSDRRPRSTSNIASIVGEPSPLQAFPSGTETYGL
jgi:hypothetical protein